MSRQLHFLFSIIVFCLYCFSVQAKEQSIAVICNTGHGQPCITAVETNDTATIVSMRFTLEPGEEFELPGSPLYLDDEHQRKYRLRTVEGIKRNGVNRCPITGILEFRLLFDPLAKDVQIFDLRTANEHFTWFDFWGIHTNRKIRKRIKGAKERILSRNDVFRNGDHATIIGRVCDYVPAEKHDSLRASICNDKGFFENTWSGVSPDGTFEMTIPIHHLQWAHIEGFRNIIPVMLVPSDTLYLKIANVNGLTPDIEYKSAKSFDVMPNLMKADVSSYLPVEFFKNSRKENYRPEVLNNIIAEEKEKANALSDYLSWKYNLAAQETRLLRMNMYIQIAATGIACVDKAISMTYFNGGKGGGMPFKVFRREMLSPGVVSCYKFLDFIQTDDYSYFATKNDLLHHLRNFSLMTSYFEKNKEEVFETYVGQPLTDDWRQALGF